MCLDVDNRKFAAAKLGWGCFIEILTAVPEDELQHIFEECLWLNFNVNIVHSGKTKVRSVFICLSVEGIMNRVKPRTYRTRLASQSCSQLEFKLEIPLDTISERCEPLNVEGKCDEETNRKIWW